MVCETLTWNVLGDSVEVIVALSIVVFPIVVFPIVVYVDDTWLDWTGEAAIVEFITPVEFHVFEAVAIVGILVTFTDAEFMPVTFIVGKTLIVVFKAGML